MSFHTFFQLLLVTMYRENIPIPQDDRLWHRIFRLLCKDPALGRISKETKELRWSTEDDKESCKELDQTLKAFRDNGFITEVTHQRTDNYNKTWTDEFAVEHLNTLRRYEKEFASFVETVKLVIANASHHWVEA